MYPFPKSDIRKINVSFPPKMESLFRPMRYKVFYGGRGAAKSWSVARALIIRGIQQPTRVLCARELQNSIKESVHKLLADQIRALDLTGYYDIQRDVIKGEGGTEFAFIGLKHNVAELKSFEGVDVCWVEEAQVVSRGSWETLIPTIRRPGSEIWITFNPDIEEDETYQRFVIQPPEDAVVVKMNWNDNPWFPEVLKKEREELRVRDPDAYLNIWEGHCRHALQGAVYADEIRKATEEGRVCRVPYEPLKPVHTAWDLGRHDATAIWFVQMVGPDYKIIRFYEDRQKDINHYLTEMQKFVYVYGVNYLPHDAKAKHPSTQRTVEEMIRASGLRVRVLPRTKIHDGINAGRVIFANSWFDEDKCADGL